MQCRKSGLSDRQWCMDHDIVPSTFYYWVRKLQQHACYDLPDTASHHSEVPAVATKQDVVCVNIQPEPVDMPHTISELVSQDSTTVMVLCKNFC